jgi:hypothetical protein
MKDDAKNYEHGTALEGLMALQLLQKHQCKIPNYDPPSFFPSSPTTPG